MRRLAGALIARLAPPEVRDSFVQDLEEAFLRRRRSSGRAMAWLWYWRQLLSSVAPFVAMRARRRTHVPDHETGSPMTFESVVQDLRYSVRLLWRSRAFTVAALVTVALGVGANTAIFSIVHGLLLKPLPYPQPDRIVAVWQNLRARGGPAQEWATPGNLADWRADTSVFASMASIRGWAPTLTGAGDPEPLRGEQVTAGYFDVLGISAAEGRAFRPDEALPNAPRVVMLSHGFWQRRFGGDRSVMGRRIVLGGEPHEIVGVLPEGFRPAIIQTADVWRPDRLNLVNPNRGAVVLRVIARLQTGVDLDHAAGATGVLAGQLARRHPQTNTGAGIAVVSFHEYVVGNARLGLLVLFGAVLFVLLLACVNIANLLLARASSRARELAVRAALGAGRRRVMRQLLTESLVLGAIGSVAGVLLSIWAGRGLVALAPAGTPRLNEVGFDGTVLGFAAILTLVVGVVFGLAPALQLSRGSLTPALKDGGRGTAEAGGRRLRRSLIAIEIAVALVLLVGSGLLLRSFLELRRSDLGFDPQNVLTGFVVPPQAKYPTEPHRRVFFDRVLERATALPGVTIAAAASVVPLNGGDSDMNFLPEGMAPPQNDNQAPATWYRLVSARYFDAMGVALSRGRAFQAGESSPVVIVNKPLADKYWPGQDPLGRRIRFNDANAPLFTVVGVAADVKQQGARSEPRLQTFVPYWQFPELGGGLTLVLKTGTPPEGLMQSLRLAVREVDPDVPVSNLATMSQLVAQSIDEPRFLASMVGLFATLAIVVAAVGVYGLMSYAVTERNREIGVRLALGATEREIFSLVLRDGLRLAAWGAGLGVVAALAVSPALGHVLFKIPAADPATFLVMAGGVVLVAIAATLIPARRATRVDPIVALRAE